jgi:hypothetical protein
MSNTLNKKWDGELGYCIRLVRNRGNISVPRDLCGNPSHRSRKGLRTHDKAV